MAAAVIRSAPVYIDGKKLGELTDCTYSITTNDAIQITLDGVIGFSDGIATVKLDASTIVPVKGISVPFLKAALTKKNVEVGILLEGKLCRCTMRIMSAEYSSTVSSGVLTGKFSLEGSGPDLTGLT